MVLKSSQLKTLSHKDVSSTPCNRPMINLTILVVIYNGHHLYAFSKPRRIIKVEIVVEL